VGTERKYNSAYKPRRKIAARFIEVSKNLKRGNASLFGSIRHRAWTREKNNYVNSQGKKKRARKGRLKRESKGERCII